MRGLRALPRTHLVVAAMVVAYLALRSLLIWRLPIFYDEGLAAAEAQTAFDHPSRETLLLAIRDRHGPLQSVFSLAPLALGFSAITAIRLLSLFAGVAGAVAVGAVTNVLAGRRAGFIAAALWIALPFSLLYDSLGLADDVAAAAVAAALLLTLKLARSPSLWSGALLGLVVAVGVLGKQSAEVALVLWPLAFIAFDWAAPDRSRRLATLIGGLGIAGTLVVASLLVPHLAPRHLRVMGSLAGSWQTHNLADVVGNYAVFARDNAPGFDRTVMGYFGVPFLVAALAGVVLLFRRRDPRGLVVVGVLVVSAAIAYALPRVPYPRYLAVTVPPLVIVAAVALARLRQAPGVIVAVVALAAPLWLSARIVASPATANYPSLDHAQLVSEWPSGTPWRAIAQALLTQARRGTTAAVAYDGDPFPPFGLAARIGRPSFPVDSRGRSPADVVYAETSGRVFVFRRYKPGMKPRLILEQPDVGGGRDWAASGYRLVARFRRRDGGPVVSLWRARRQ